MLLPNNEFSQLDIWILLWSSKWKDLKVQYWRLAGEYLYFRLDKRVTFCGHMISVLISEDTGN